MKKVRWGVLPEQAGVLPGDLGLDQLRQQLQALKAFNKARLGRDGVRDPFLVHVDLGANRHPRSRTVVFMVPGRFGSSNRSVLLDQLIGDEFQILSRRTNGSDRC